MENQLKLRNVIIKGGYKLEFSENSKGLPTAKKFRLLGSGANKGTYKFVEGFYFQNEEKRNVYAENVIKKVQQALLLRKASVMGRINNSSNVVRLFPS